MSLTDDFNKAVIASKTMTQKPPNESLLELYGLYKQATEGDNTELRPGGFDFKAIAKHDAWESKKGISKDDAMSAYTVLVANLLTSYA